MKIRRVNNMKEFKKDKKELEIKIGKLLNEFKEKYSIEICDIELCITLDDDGEPIYVIKLDVRL